MASKSIKSRSIAEIRVFSQQSLGTLYLVGTPIGNLEDLSLRALRVLREVDLIACEDTRQTQKLLNHFQIEKQTTSYHVHNELTKASELILRLEEGSQIALVSDAGMPGISDPGYRLVHLCLRHNIPVVPVPGPSAVVAVLAASGLPTHAFQFFGFLPARKNQRRKFFEKLKDFRGTTIVFESPRRVTEALQDALAVLGNRPTVVAREVTKLHEEFLRGRCSEVLENLRKRPAIPGEITLLFGGEHEEPPAAVHAKPLKERVQELMREQNLNRMEALKTVARERHISKS
ncbi:MAG: 16S rRNA (cytidine(1402)-2'-O)-methyltransferase, partial [Acidobacteria bacterium]|nr:16S rRNA (cytidine(1402)-2'-O)-methyltransferase [Acidobacteriota bacterium]